MTYGKIVKCRARTTYQFGAGINGETRVSLKSSCCTGGSVRHLQAPGLSVHARSSSDWEKGSDSGYKNRIYGQVVSELDSIASSICKSHRGDFKRHSYTGPGSFSAQGSRAWIKRENLIEMSIWYTALTGCQLTRLSKLTGF